MDSQSDSVNNSIADIYIKELINKHQQSTQKPSKVKPKALDLSASSSSIMSETKWGALKKKRMSMNIDINDIDVSNFSANPAGGRSGTNLDKNSSASAFTVGSEKSCY